MSASCHLQPGLLGGSCPTRGLGGPICTAGQGLGPCLRAPSMGWRVSVYVDNTRVPRQVSCRRGACPRPGGVPRTCCTATFDLLLRLWVWPRPRSRLLREVWARVPARRLGARRGGPGRAGAACRACGQGDEGTCGARPSFLDSGSWAQGTARPHPSLPSLTPSTWPLCSELPKLALMG